MAAKYPHISGIGAAAAWLRIAKDLTAWRQLIQEVVRIFAIYFYDCGHIFLPPLKWHCKRPGGPHLARLACRRHHWHWGCPTSRAFREVGRHTADTDGSSFRHNWTVRHVIAQTVLTPLVFSHVEQAEALLRRRRLTFHHLQLLPPAAITRHAAA